jgi:hypothetical protein
LLLVVSKEKLAPGFDARGELFRTGEQEGSKREKPREKVRKIFTNHLTKTFFAGMII